MSIQSSGIFDFISLLFRERVWVVWCFRAVQVFFQAVDDEFMVRNVVQVGCNNRTYDCIGSFDADREASAADRIISAFQSVNISGIAAFLPYEG